jgi:hypothetical protein
MGVAAGNDATTAAEVVDLWSSTSKVAGATFVNLQPDRAKQPKLKTASGFIAGRCTFLSTVFNYASNAGTDKKPAISVTMFENAGIGVGKTITYSAGLLTWPTGTGHFRRGRCLGSHGRPGPKMGAIDASG